MCLRTVAAAAFGLLLLGAPDRAHADPTVWLEADFARSENGEPPRTDSAWTRQRLPDDWRTTRPGVAGYGWYGFDLDLPAPPGELHAIYVPRLGVEAVVFVNGQRVGDTGPGAETERRTWKRPQLFTVPPALLRAGANRIELRLRGDAAGAGRNDAWNGLGPVSMGLDRELRPLYQSRMTWQVIAPVALAGAIGLTGLFFIVYWTRRRAEALYGLFGGAAMLWAARTIADLVFHRELPQPHWDVWLTAAYALYATMLASFALRFAGTPWHRVERPFWLMALLSPPLLYVATWLGYGSFGARALLLVVILFVAVASAAVVAAAWRQRSLGISLMALTGVVSLGFGVHDWFAAIRPELFDRIRLVPYSAILFITVAGWLLLNRFAQSTEALEQLNVELDRRVEEKSAELQANLRELERTKAQAESANQAKSRFLAAASHDLRQPLHAIGLFGAALDMRAKAPDVRGLVGKLNASIAALEDLVNELLDVSKLDAGADKPEFRDFPVQVLLERIAIDYAPLAAEKGLRLRVRGSMEVAHSDPGLLERLVRNLVSNAVRYTERGGILVSCRQREGRLWIEVWDTGVGISPGERERIFEEFYQVGNVERDRTKGIGLGLAIVRRIADLLGERLEVKSRPGRGSMFAVSVAPGGAAPRREGPAAHAPAPLLGRRLIALIDDDVVVRDAMVTLLAEQGLDVTAAASLEEARRALAERRRAPDLVIADMRLAAGATGVDAVRTLRARYGADLPALLVTGETTRDRVAEAVASGIPILQKPVAPAHLLAEIDRLARAPAVKRR
ncbi:MAG: hybrid sensor histidine kinase/response regulator [Burkholderiales bacterium]|jgi:signal transduction histidine kinase/CheY-like chemotaxis protein|nr:hybrid sensor histidine kinase/response regulator [Burkholderiales bacterium]